mmetsp:Transcript_21726/g.31463  ORF Transcript_21726/g.31463 Transcript_21726/m.31463 type:complete len:164 (-) Transcript_21726:102-593(-)
MAGITAIFKKLRLSYTTINTTLVQTVVGKVVVRRSTIAAAKIMDIACLKRAQEMAVTVCNTVIVIQDGARLWLFHNFDISSGSGSGVPFVQRKVIMASLVMNTRIVFQAFVAGGIYTGATAVKCLHSCIISIEIVFISYKHAEDCSAQPRCFFRKLYKRCITK